MYSIHIGLTERCNLNCNHCYRKQKCEKQYGDCLDEDKLISTIETIGASTITYTFGENLLYKNFYGFSELLKDKKYYQILISNGLLIQSHEIVNNLEYCGINEVCISIDSISARKHDENRGYEGSFVKAVKALELLMQSKMKVTLSVSISDKNVEEIPFILNWGKNMGINSFSFMRQRHSNGMQQMGRDYLSIMEKLIMICISQNIYLKIHDFSLENLLAHMYDKGEIDGDIFKMFIDMNCCHAFKEILLITPNGDIYPCLFSNHIIGNIYKEKNLYDLFSKVKNNFCVCI